MPIFQTERKASQATVGWVKAAKRVFIASTFAGLVMPVFLTQTLDRPTKGMLNFLAIVACGSWIAADGSTKRMGKIDELYDQEQLEQFKRGSQHRSRFTAAQEEIAGYAELVSHVLSRPIWEWGRWEKQHGLQGLLPPLQHPEVAEAIAHGQLPVTVNPNNQPSLSELTSTTNEIDYSWFDNSFIDTSKAVFGGKGTGKSTYMAFEAARFLQLHPDGILLIGDIHYDEESSKWLPGISSEVLLDKYLAKKADQVLQVVRWCKKELRDRINKGDKKRVPVKLILDEFLGLTRRWEKEEVEEVMEFIAESQDEGRKFRVNVTLGLHSIKEKRSGIDSSVLFQMDLLVLGGSIADTTIKWPADFEVKELSSLRNQVQASLKKGQGYACVVKRQNDAPMVVVLPDLELNAISISTGDNQPDTSAVKASVDADWLMELQKWAMSLDHNPSVDEVKTQFQLLAKTLKLEVAELSDRDAELVMEYIEQWRQN